jgi:hypothetical protein
MILYHVTPTENLQSIYTHGLNPELSTGKRKVTWFVRADGLLWAISHISAHWKTSVDKISVISVSLDEDELKRTCWRPVFTKETLTPKIRLMHNAQAIYWIDRNEPERQATDQ